MHHMLKTVNAQENQSAARKHKVCLYAKAMKELLMMPSSTLTPFTPSTMENAMKLVDQLPVSVTSEFG